MRDGEVEVVLFLDGMVAILVCMGLMFATGVSDEVQGIGLKMALRSSCGIPRAYPIDARVTRAIGARHSVKNTTIFEVVERGSEVSDLGAG